MKTLRSQFGTLKRGTHSKYPLMENHAIKCYDTEPLMTRKLQPQYGLKWGRYKRNVKIKD